MVRALIIYISREMVEQSHPKIRLVLYSNGKNSLCSLLKTRNNQSFIIENQSHLKRCQSLIPPIHKSVVFRV